MPETCGYIGHDEWHCPEAAWNGGLCIFHNQNLNKDLSFLKSELETKLERPDEGPLRFDGAVFIDGISWLGFIFARSVSFFRAKFYGKKTDFSQTEFRGEFTNFACAEFHVEDIFFKNAKFLAEKTTFDANFYGKSVNFSGAKFCGKKINFSGADFGSADVDFSGAEFEGQRTEFRGKYGNISIRFDGARFQAQETLFFAAEFGGNVVFKGTKFISKDTRFNNVKFLGALTSFVEAEFKGSQTSFIATEFRNKETNFGEARIHGVVTFAHFLSGVQFQPFNSNRVDFRWITFSPKGELIFDNVDLSRVEFMFSDLSHMKFLNVKWDHQSNRKWGPYRWGMWRSRIYDERVWREDWHANVHVNLDQLALLYRKLIAYYKSTEENRLVGHFNYGLMEIEWYRKESEEDLTVKTGTRGKSNSQLLIGHLRQWLRKWISWEAIYRYSSGYGEDYTLAAIMVVVLIVFFTVSYWILGVPSDTNHTALWQSVLDALFFSVQVGSLGKLGFYEVKNLGPQGYLRYLFFSTYLLETILVPVQVGFFAFALRNRFRR